ncbi:uncharacterized protein LOC143891151 [Tasmannia lanceolata]|uniref:uncharacterized protein LOC143891151 n=1 Tax=Tasmannia lanceolata TaxID=3420 RepID=UPI0040645C0D
MTSSLVKAEQNGVSTESGQFHCPACLKTLPHTTPKAVLQAMNSVLQIAQTYFTYLHHLHLNPCISVEFTPLPLSPSEILKQCLASSHITLPAIRPPPNPLPANWRADQHCEYHRGPDHLTDNCIALKYKIPKLIDNKGLAFQARPNVINNPLPGHANPSAPVNAITVGYLDFDPLTLICALEPVSEPQIIFSDESNLNESISPLIITFDELTNQEFASPLVITYEPQIPQVITYDEPELDEVRHVTRGRRIFKLAELRVENLGPLVQGEESQYVKDPDDEVVQQMKKNQAVIFVWGLLIASKKHREAVLRELNTTQVSPEISLKQLVEVVALTQAARVVSFSDQELPPQGRNHAKALHITVICKGKKVPSVLVDNGSALNVSFNMLLGHPWLHKEGVVASTLHQKLKFIKDGKLITVRDDEDPEIG